MSFVPCQSKCTYEGTHCEGCGRSHEEIKATKQLVQTVVEFVKQHEYDNADQFTQYLAAKVLKKLAE
jgi:predicted Fe-S protein YdhL (DUF1289 family)